MICKFIILIKVKCLFQIWNQIKVKNFYLGNQNFQIQSDDKTLKELYDFKFRQSQSETLLPQSTFNPRIFKSSNVYNRYVNSKSLSLAADVYERKLYVSKLTYLYDIFLKRRTNFLLKGFLVVYFVSFVNSKIHSRDQKLLQREDKPICYCDYLTRFAPVAGALVLI